MKLKFAALCTAILLSTTPNAFAASSVDLTVKGTITPAACIPSLSDGGIADYGNIPAKDLNQGTTTSLGDRTLTLQVKCDAATPFALYTKDNRPGTAASPTRLFFGLGLINGSQKLGHYFLSTEQAIADGKEVYTVKSNDGQTDWRPNLFWWPAQYMSVAAMDNPNQPIAAQDLTLVLTVSTFIARADGLDLTHAVPLDGSATLEMNYL